MTLPDPGATERFVESLSAGIHRAPPTVELPAVAAALEALGFATFNVDLKGADGKSEILDAMARGLDFPVWVGRNWDALEDAMRDLSWLPSGARGRALLVHGAAPPGAGSREELTVLEDVLGSAVASWAGTDAPLVVVTEPRHEAG